MAKDANGLTPKQEMFCQKYIECKGNASEAYRQSYDAGKMKPEVIWTEASLLMDNPNVAERVKKLQEIHQKRHEITVDYITDMLKEAYSMARTKEETAQITNAANSLAKLHGLITDKAEVKNTVVMMPAIKLGENELNFDVGN